MVRRRPRPPRRRARPARPRRPWPHPVVPSSTTRRSAPA